MVGMRFVFVIVLCCSNIYLPGHMHPRISGGDKLLFLSCCKCVFSRHPLTPPPTPLTQARMSLAVLCRRSHNVKCMIPFAVTPQLTPIFFCARIDGGSQGRDAGRQLPLLGLQSSWSLQMDEQNALIFLGLETRSVRRMVSFAHAEISLTTKKKKN